MSNFLPSRSSLPEGRFGCGFFSTRCTRAADPWTSSQSIDSPNHFLMKPLARILLIVLLILIPLHFASTAEAGRRDGLRDGERGSSKRTGSHDQVQEDRKERNREAATKKRRDARDKKEAKRQDRYDEARASEADDFHVRTLGAVCVYGTDGRPIFRPRGVICKGEAGYEEQQRAIAESERSYVPAGIAPDPPKVKSRRKKKSKGRCIYSGGRLVFAPVDMDCPQ
jgi:hypothetical protein